MKSKRLPLVLCLVVGFLCPALWPVRVAFADQLSDDEAAIALHIQSLGDEKSAAREAAAKALREIVARYPGGTSNLREADGGKAYWTEKANQIKPDETTREAAIKILPQPDPSAFGIGIAMGDMLVDNYRLDNHWSVLLRSEKGKITHPPALNRRELVVRVAPPQNFTGLWVQWYVNGQKAQATQYKNGLYDGPSTRFRDNGRKGSFQYYSKKIANGAAMAWHSGGQLMYKGQYKNGKPDGKWLHWSPNGRKQREANYKNGVQHGLDGAWDEQGGIQYRQEYKNGKEVS